MRGTDQQPESLFSYVAPEERVPADHPLRPIRRMANEALKKLSPRFAKLYAAGGRPSIAPEKLLRALLLQVLYSVRSERLLMEQLDYNLLFRWFVGLSMDDPIWNPTTFTKNRDRLLEGDIAQAFFTCRGGTDPREETAVGRALLDRRHIAGSLGLAEELSPEGRSQADAIG